MAILTVLAKRSVSPDLEIAVSSRFWVVRVLVLTGAGVSAESGIPTFRGKDGYWRNLDPAKLATPEAFARDPQLVWDWYRERRQRIRNARPNAAHDAVARLAQRTDEFFFVTRCSRCEFERHDYEHEHEHEDEHENEGVIPRCPECDAFMRPGVVWFGEQLSRNELERVEDFLDGGACDVVIVAGTTATFGYIIDWALRGSELIEVNPEETPLSRFATQQVREPAAIALPRIVDQLIASPSKL